MQGIFNFRSIWRLLKIWFHNGRLLLQNMDLRQDQAYNNLENYCFEESPHETLRPMDNKPVPC